MTAVQFAPSFGTLQALLTIERCFSLPIQVETEGRFEIEMSTVPSRREPTVVATAPEGDWPEAVEEAWPDGPAQPRRSHNHGAWSAVVRPDGMFAQRVVSAPVG